LNVRVLFIIQQSTTMIFKREYTKAITFFQAKFGKELRHRDKGACEVLLILLIGLHFDLSTIKEVSDSLGINKNKLYSISSKLTISDWRKLFRAFFSKESERQLLDLKIKSAATWSNYAPQLSIDDSTLRKWGSTLRYLGKWWSGQLGKVVKGYNVILIVLKLKEEVIPVKIWLLSKYDSEGTRLDRASKLFEELATDLQSAGIEIAKIPISMDAGYASGNLAEYLVDKIGFSSVVVGARSTWKLMDSEYDSVDLANTLAELMPAHRWQIEEEQAWGINEKVLVHRGIHETFGKVTTLGRFQVGKMRYVFAVGKHRVAEIYKVWTEHYKIEQIFRVLKQIVSWGKYQLRGESGAFACVFLPFLALALLMHLREKLPKPTTFYQLSRAIKIESLSGICDFLQDITFEHFTIKPPTSDQFLKI